MPMIRKTQADTDAPQIEDFSRITQRQCAAAHGWSARNLRRLVVDKGFPQNADGSYDLPATIRWRTMHTNDYGNLTQETRYWFNGPF